MGIIKTVLLAIVLLIFAVCFYMIYKNLRTPENLGVNNGKLGSVPSSPNAVSSQTDVQEKKVDPLIFKGSLAKSKTAVLEALKSYGGVEIITNTDTYIYAVNITETMRYRDDLEFYFDEAAKVIHFRSSSRVGYSDRGLNRKRYNDIAKYYSNQ